MEQFNNLIEFRQAIYEEGFTGARDAQFELLDALLLSPPLRSFAELSLSPVFQRRWPSVYAAIEKGRQDQEQLEGHFIGQVPTAGTQVFALDSTAWPHPAARTLADRQYVYHPTAPVNGGSVVVGHPYSVLAWVPERGSSWAPPVSVRRISSRETAVEVGVRQVKQLCRQREVAAAQWLQLIVGDCRYGNHRFLGPLEDARCGKLVRMRCDRVLYGEPGAYSGKGRPRVHGDRFAFQEPETWGEPDQLVQLEDEHWGEVRLRRWDNKHARQDAATLFSVILVETHREREKSPKPFWLAYQPPPDQEPGEQALDDLRYWYHHRWPVEPSIRFRKQYLCWTLPRFQTPDSCDRWTMLVNVAQWELMLARDLVKDHPLPWQPAQERLTPERVLQGLGGLFRQIGTPVAPPERRGNAPGWPKGRPRTRRKRHAVVRRTKQNAQAA